MRLGAKWRYLAGATVIFFTCLAIVSLGGEISVTPLPQTSTPPTAKRTEIDRASPTREEVKVRWIDTLFRNLSGGVRFKSEASANDQEKHCSEMRELVMKEYIPHLPLSLQQAIQEQIGRYEAVANGTAPPSQKYLVWSLSGGLGNRFQSLASSLVASLLTGRVLLLKDWFTPLAPNVKGAKGIIYPSNASRDYALEHLDKLFDMKGVGWPTNELLICSIFPFSSLRDFRRMYPTSFPLGRSPPTDEDHVKVDISARHDKRLVRWDQLLCTNMTSSFFNARFVYVWTNQYYLPGFYANPLTRSRMLSWFPNGPYSTVVKLVALPGLPAARQSVEFLHQHRELKLFSYAALQIRAFQVSSFSSLAASFSKCLTVRGAPIDKAMFLATMHAPILDSLRKDYGPHVVTRKPPNHEQGTGKDFGKDVDAFVDMLLLAFGGKLYVSHGSTFGGFVAALADKHPIRVYSEGRCDQLFSPEPCFSSWFRYDKIYHRKQELSCRVSDIPSGAMYCE